MDRYDPVQFYPLTPSDEEFLRALKIDPNDYFKFKKSSVNSNEMWLIKNVTRYSGLAQLCHKLETKGERLNYRQYRAMLKILRSDVENRNERYLITVELQRLQFDVKNFDDFIPASEVFGFARSMVQR
jgi:hypothetical protein